MGPCTCAPPPSGPPPQTCLSIFPDPSHPTLRRIHARDGGADNLYSAIGYASTLAALTFIVVAKLACRRWRGVHEGRRQISDREGILETESGGESRLDEYGKLWSPSRCLHAAAAEVNDNWLAISPATCGSVYI